MSGDHPQDGEAPADPQPLPRRSRPTSGVLHVEGKPTIIFGTVCTKDRKPWLATKEVHALLREAWTEADAWVMGQYMIMPDHIHFFNGFTGSPIEYENWARYWKSRFTKRHKVCEHRWQANDWDTRMRTQQQYEMKWEYVRWNPVHHQLADNPTIWPFHGTIHELRWEE